MRRRRPNFFPMVLLVALATTGLWMRSYLRADEIGVIHAGVDRPYDHGNITDKYAAVSTRGGIRLELLETDDRNPGTTALSKPTWHLQASSDSATEPAERTSLGFAWGADYAAGVHAESGVRFAVVPHWFFVSLCAFAALPLLARRRREQGLCESCGYDLTGNVSGTCPECGKRTE